MAHTFTNLLTHAVFSTSERRPFLSDLIRADLHAYIGGILREMDATPIIIGGAADHVHLLIRLPAPLAIADCLRVVKTNSSRWVKERWTQQRLFAWQSGYGAFSVSESSRQTVIRYIGNQQRHHQRFSYQHEFLALLARHGVAYDERNIWH